jgi:HAD superfamily hydrolase (TIGR01509 family)
MTRAAQPLRRPQAVIFDMDGLMLDTESLATRTWADAANLAGVEFDLALLPMMIGRNYRDSRALLLAHYGDEYPAEKLTAACLAAFDAIVAREGIALKAGVVELLDWLETQNIPRAVATSTRGERARAQLSQQGLFNRFATLVGGDEVAHGKPAPDIFVEAAMRLGVPVEACVVLEDSEPGVLGAIAAGTTPIMVPDLHPPSPTLLATQTLVLPSLLEVAAHLASLPR